MAARDMLCCLNMMNQHMFKKVSMALGLVCFASLASAARAVAAPPRPSVAAATSVTVKIPQRNAGYAGVTTIGNPSFPGVSGDSQPYHLKGSVVYEPRGNSLAFKEIHISGWSDSPDGRPQGACG